MKKLFKNIIVMGLIAFVISISVSSFFPIYWGDDVQVSKINFYKEKKENFNALFFGGSLDYRHISPKIINTELNKKNIDLRGFNFGADSHNFIQAVNEASYTIDNYKNDNLKYVFISLSTEANLSYFNLHTNKLICWMNIKSVSTLLKTITVIDEDPKLKIVYAYGYILSWFENALNFGKLKDKLNYAVNKNYTNPIAIGNDKDGFAPLELDKNGQVLNPETKMIKYVLMVLNLMYKKDNSVHETFNKTIFDTYSDTSKHNKNVDYLYKICDDLINKYNKKGIKVIFFIPPRVPSGYKQIIPVYNKLPSANKFNLADPNKFPEFYDIKYGFDNFHMDRSGAEIYSHKMAIEIAEILKN